MRVGAESGDDERKAEALAVEMRDLDSEPRQAIVAAFVRNSGGKSRVLSRV